MLLRYPDSFALWNILAVANWRSGQLDRAVGGFEKASRLVPDDPEVHYNLGVVREAQGDADAAVRAYRKAISVRPDHARALNNLGVVLFGQNDLEEAARAQQRAVVIEPDYAEAHNNLGVTLLAQGRSQAALCAFSQAVALWPRYLEAHYNRGLALEACGRFDDAVAAYERALELHPDHAPALSQKLYLQARICDFSAADEFSKVRDTLGISGGRIAPFTVLWAQDDPARQMARAHVWSRQSFDARSAPAPARHISGDGKIRVGYFSSDFGDHAVSCLVSGLLREHDRRHFEIHAYGIGPARSGPMLERIQGAVDHFADIRTLSDAGAVELARSHGLDIAIDLNGYTRHARTGLFARRLAPVQINYLGYPGTMGADFMDYIVADRVLIPSSERAFYSEKVIYLAHTFQPNDNRRPVSKGETARSDFGLPQDGPVLCCFHNSHKIGRREFDTWMRLLCRLEGSVAWFSRMNAPAVENLRKQASARNVDPDRLIFADHMPSYADYLARFRHADLFLDAFAYNACTTASDALWAGIPVVTKAGRTYAARVGASLLAAVDLPELVTETQNDYEELILDLCRSPDKLAALKRKLDDNRHACALFDTANHARVFETGLRAAHELFVRGSQAQDIDVA